MKPLPDMIPSPVAPPKKLRHSNEVMLHILQSAEHPNIFLQSRPFFHPVVIVCDSNRQRSWILFRPAASGQRTVQTPILNLQFHLSGTFLEEAAEPGQHSWKNHSLMSTERSGTLQSGGLRSS
ncbi:hypothetical protein OJAV_G00039530 [Oryzias javanicus]|uniref:Uncharacterized protein n=1 Tax=Oryzias javanicus TaxID=123683 RepID=A0A437DCL7_ORYJA|nr:hypothetical protein OJAV_G00039530 [Oryzias javanicus]